MTTKRIMFHGVWVGLGLSLLLGVASAFGGNGTLTIMITSDMHSVLKPYGYFSADTGEYEQGGLLRLAERIIERRAQYAAQGHATLVLDGGDFTAGTFFHYAYKGVAELSLMSSIWDATTLGNHELDWTPESLAGALQVVTSTTTPAPIISSNILDWGDSTLQAFRGSVIQEYLLLEVSGIKVGIFGLMTRGVAALSQPYPLEFSDLSTSEGVMAALAVAKTLEVAGADVIILLAHNGFGYDYQLADYATRLGYKLDLIISGHDHVANPNVIRPEQSNTNSYIVQVGAYTDCLGRISLSVSNKTVSVSENGFDLEYITSANPDIQGVPNPNPDPTGWEELVNTYTAFANPVAMAASIAQQYPAGWAEPTVDGVTWGDFSGGPEQDLLIDLGLLAEPYLWQTYSIIQAYDQMETTLAHADLPYGDEGPDDWYHVPARTEVDLSTVPYAESNLGNLISDSIFLRGMLVDFATANSSSLGFPGIPGDEVTDFAVEADGTIRFSLPNDDNGITLSDAYQVLPLGIGLKSFDLVNGTPPYDASGNPEYGPGFDLMRFYIRGSDLKTALELGVAAVDLGDIFFLHWAGLSFDYDLSKPITDRVSSIKVGDFELYEGAIYKGTTSTYVVVSLLSLASLLEPATRGDDPILSPEAYAAFAGITIYLDYKATVPITDLDSALVTLYCGKEWIAFADKIMWPWWYGGLNGIIRQSQYGGPEGRMNDITPTDYTLDPERNGVRSTAPTAIGQLLGLKKGQAGYKHQYDFTQDNIIDQQDLRAVLDPL